MFTVRWYCLQLLLPFVLLLVIACVWLSGVWELVFWRWFGCGRFMLLWVEFWLACCGFIVCGFLVRLCGCVLVAKGLVVFVGFLFVCWFGLVVGCGL